jgi:hypothetical protein
LKFWREFSFLDAPVPHAKYLKFWREFSCSDAPVHLPDVAAMDALQYSN